jgi:hypothetical protein
VVQELLIKVLLVAELELIPPNMAVEAVAVLEQLALMAVHQLVVTVALV